MVIDAIAHHIAARKDTLEIGDETGTQTGLNIVLPGIQC
jgi:hypothetical protein